MEYCCLGYFLALWFERGKRFFDDVAEAEVSLGRVKLKVCSWVFVLVSKILPRSGGSWAPVLHSSPLSKLVLWGVKRIAISIIMIIQFMLRVFDENFPCFSFVELETFKFFFAALFGLFLFHFLRMFCSLFHLSLTIKILH